MILFFILSALLVILTLVLLLPVFYRDADVAEPNRTDINVGIAKAQARELKQRLDAGEISQQDYADEKTRLEAGLARDIESEEVTSANTLGQWMQWPLLAALPVAAGALYLTLGSPEALDPESYVRQAPVAASQQGQGQQTQQAPDMQVIMARIKAQLEETPDDAQGWFMLGRGHLTLGEYTEAELALRRSLEIDDSNIDVRIRLADAIALTQDGRLVGEPTEVLKSALDLQPNHPQGLWLYGMAKNQNGEPAQAIAIWQRLLAQLGNDPQAKSEVEQLIAEANAQLPEADRIAIGELPETLPETQPETRAETRVSGAGIKISVDVKPGLADDLPADTAVFIYAKAASGPPMPLAVVRQSLSELPITVNLTDAQAMMEAMKISAFDEVVVGARISKTGDPIAQSGDFFSESATIKHKEQTGGIALTISGVVP